MELQKADQRNFKVMGENLFTIVNKLANNQRVCRLLKYNDSEPFIRDEKHPDILDGTSLINNQIVIIPKFQELIETESSFVVVVFDNFIINPANPDFKISTVRFDVACPYTEWIVNESNLRPYLIMQEIDLMFNKAKMSGIGNLQFVSAMPLTLSPQMGGYSMRYSINEFN